MLEAHNWESRNINAWSFSKLFYFTTALHFYLMIFLLFYLIFIPHSFFVLFYFLVRIFLYLWTNLNFRNKRRRAYAQTWIWGMTFVVRIFSNRDRPSCSSDSRERSPLLAVARRIKIVRSTCNRFSYRSNDRYVSIVACSNVEQVSGSRDCWWPTGHSISRILNRDT